MIKAILWNLCHILIFLIHHKTTIKTVIMGSGMYIHWHWSVGSHTCSFWHIYSLTGCDTLIIDVFINMIQLCWDIFILFGRMRLDNLTERVSMIKLLSYMNFMSVKTDLTTIWSPYRTLIRVCIIISTTYHHFYVCWYVICILLLTAHHTMWSFNHNRMSLPSIIQHKYNINEELISPF